MSHETTLYLKIGIASRDQIRNRTLAIASGRHVPASDEPKVWFTSLREVSAVFSEQSMLLLEILRTAPRFTLQEIADQSLIAPDDIAGSLHTLESFGLVDLEEDSEGLITEIKPKAYDRIQWDLQLNAA